MQSNKQMSKTTAATPFCKFCEGAGEPKEVYNSHWQFSKPSDGVLTCPKLLNYKCKNCDGAGHIEKRCPIPRQKKERVEKFCRFCYNAKNPDFLEHNQFDKDGVVQCSALLAIECQGCGEKGHTKRYCPGTVVEKVYNKEKPVEVLLQTSNMDLFPMLTPSLGEKGNVVTLSGWSKMVSAKPMPLESAKPMPSNKPAPPNKPVPMPPSKVAPSKMEKLLEREPPRIPMPPNRSPPSPPKIEDSDSSSDEEEAAPYTSTTSWADCE